MQIVIDYIKKFEQFEEEIGVVSPYAQQCKAIKESCRQNGFEKINIGTAEEFQGQEKSIMIVSTVRSREENLGFIRDKRVRFINFFAGPSVFINIHLKYFKFFSENQCNAYTGQKSPYCHRQP